MQNTQLYIFHYYTSNFWNILVGNFKLKTIEKSATAVTSATNESKCVQYIQLMENNIIIECVELGKFKFYRVVLV